MESNAITNGLINSGNKISNEKSDNGSFDVWDAIALCLKIYTILTKKDIHISGISCTGIPLTNAIVYNSIPGITINLTLTEGNLLWCNCGTISNAASADGTMIPPSPYIPENL